MTGFPETLGMYSTCLFCNGSLGTNEAIEQFPVGRKLAFDGEKGRLWVICAACGRWNLSPLEERWEAIEACERAYRATRLRTSTGNIGLARLRDGTELVRIGRPLRPEFAAWRYGDVMAGRLRRTWYTAGGLAGMALFAAGGALVMPALFLGVVPLGIVGAIYASRADGPAAPDGSGRTLRALRDNAGEPVLQPRHVILRTRLRPQRDLPDGWGLGVTTARGIDAGTPVVQEAAGFTDVKHHLLTGTPSMRALSLMLAWANASGGTRREVSDAVRLIQRVGVPERYFAQAEHDARKQGWGYQNVWEMPSIVRLALEMASHEESERRALEGELAELEAAWRDAEELAAISDSLLVPPVVEQKLAAIRANLPAQPRDLPPAAPRSPEPDALVDAGPKPSGLQAARAEYARRMAARRGRRE